MKKILIYTMLTLLLITPIYTYADGNTDKKPPHNSSEETSPPSGNITIDKDGENITITIENKKKFGSITIVKVDSDTREPIANVKFVIKDKTTGEIVAEGVTNAEGILTFDNLPLGDYIYEEVTAPKPY